MGPVAPAGVANPGTQRSRKQENWGSAASVMLLRKALCVKGLAVWQIAWYQRSAERIDNWSAMNGLTITMPLRGFSKKPNRPGRCPRPPSLQALAAKLGA